VSSIKLVFPINAQRNFSSLLSVGLMGYVIKVNAVSTRVFNEIYIILSDIKVLV
jgi:hypothetical protein